MENTLTPHLNEGILFITIPKSKYKAIVNRIKDLERLLSKHKENKDSYNNTLRVSYRKRM